MNNIVLIHCVKGINNSLQQRFRWETKPNETNTAACFKVPSKASSYSTPAPVNSLYKTQTHSMEAAKSS